MSVYNNDQIFKLLDKVRSERAENLESESVEFKRFSTAQEVFAASDLAAEISALANKFGGVIIFGVANDRLSKSEPWSSQLIGTEQLDELEVKERLLGRISPRIELEVVNVKFANKNFAVVHVPKRPDQLVMTSAGKCCIREGRSSRPMSPEEIASAVRSFTSFDWSAEPVAIDPVEALDPNSLDAAISDFCRIRKMEERPDTLSFLEAIGAVHNGVLLRGGLLFLGTPEAIRAELGDFEYRFTWKTSAGNLIQNDVWSRNIWISIDRVREHFRDCNSPGKFKYKDSEFEVPSLDEQAFHEAFLNAVVHRDYTSDGMIAVTYSGGQMIIASPGVFYGGVTAENIARHQPRHRNKALARMLMTYQLVDRAGMGVLRMGLGSLKYGRAFPEFRERSDSVEVRMQAEYLRASVTVLAIDAGDAFGIPELWILNSVYEVGYVSVTDAIRQLGRIVDDAWEAIQQAVSKIDIVEFCGRNDGIYIRVRRNWLSFMEVTRSLRVSGSSKKHVSLYTYLMRHGSAANSDIRAVLGHSYTSQTSTFLRNAEYVRRKGSGRSALWSLV